MTQIENDPRQFLLVMAASFSEMDPRILPKNMRVKMLTTDTSEALVLTLRGIVSLVKTLLQHGFSYVMLGQIQSDRIEGEFSIYGIYLNHLTSMSKTLVVLSLFLKMNLLRRLFRECFLIDRCRTRTVTYIAGYITQKDSGKNTVSTSCR